MTLLVSWFRKSGSRGHPRSPDPKLGVFGVIWGQNPKIFKPRQIIYQNEALGALITKKWFPRSLEVIRPQIKGYLGSFGVKIQKISNLDNLYIKMKLLVTWLRKHRLDPSIHSRQFVDGFWSINHG